MRARAGSFLGALLVLTGLSFMLPARGAPALVPPALTSVGVALFALAQTRWSDGTPADQPSVAPLSEAEWISAAAALSLLAAKTTWVVVGRHGDSYLHVVTLWPSAAGCYLMAFARTIELPASWRRWFGDHGWELYALGAITLLGATLRFYELGAVPRVVNGDEGWLGSVPLTTG